MFQQSEFSAARYHEEFIWLHDRYNENDEYAGLIVTMFFSFFISTNSKRLFQIPPAPPRPDFDASRAKLQKLSENENTLTKEEYEKMKQELEASVFFSIFDVERFLLLLFSANIWRCSKKPFQCTKFFFNVSLLIRSFETIVIFVFFSNIKKT